MTTTTLGTNLDQPLDLPQLSLAAGLRLLKSRALSLALAFAGLVLAAALLAETALLPLLIGLSLISSLMLALTLASCLKLLRSQKDGLRQLLEQNQKLELELSGLRQQEALKANLLCVLAHDLRSPFATLKNIVWLLEQNLLDPSDSQELLPKVRLQIDGLYSSLDNLLLWASRHPSGQAGPPQPVPVAAIAREIAGMYHSAAEQKALELTVPEGPSARALIDPDALRLILRNLLDNAVKFTPSGGRIAIAVEPCDGHVLLQVQDTGIGMNSHQLRGLFTGAGEGEPGTQGVQVRKGTAGEKGLGLGLQLCHKYLHSYGGQLSVSSQPGQGTCFKISLPASN